MLKFNCIYFEKVAPDLKALLEQEKPAAFNLIYWTDLTKVEKTQSLAKADAFFTGTYLITRELMEQSPRLRIVQKLGVGVDNIDSNAASQLGIAVGNVPGGNANGVAELTIGMILSVYRRLSILNQETKEGKWLMWTYRASSYEMKGKTHGIIGFGHVGQEVARLSQAFGTSILYYNRHQVAPEIETELHAHYTELDELLSKSDIVSLHIPLFPQTKNCINADKLSLMKPSAILINVSRGNIVNEKDLYQALVEKRLFGAGIDVWAQEPPSIDNPLLKLDCVLATPHIGGGTADTSRNIFRMSFANIHACLTQASFHCVNHPVK
jgi:D-3-phosphoglycerate dehydrogenase / 2-oxoglutarate reductase